MKFQIQNEDLLATWLALFASFHVVADILAAFLIAQASARAFSFFFFLLPCRHSYNTKRHT